MNNLQTNIGLKRIYEIHDIDVNQKYGEGNSLPYSFHLKAVVAQGRKFSHLILPKLTKYPSATAEAVFLFSLAGHDLKEDARHTYNDLISLGVQLGLHRSAAVDFADIVWSVSDSDGKNRAQRKDDLFYKELLENEVGVFDKLSDMAANRIYGKLTNSSQYEMYREEFPKFRLRVERHYPDFKPFFDYIANI